MQEWRRSRMLVFWMRAKHAQSTGPAQSSVFHNFACRGPTKQAHRQALNWPDGLLSPRGAMSCSEAGSQRLLQVVADYTRRSAALAADPRRWWVSVSAARSWSK